MATALYSLLSGPTPTQPFLCFNAAEWYRLRGNGSSGWVPSRAMLAYAQKWDVISE
jgi:uncharacterized protein YraI